MNKINHEQEQAQEEKDFNKAKEILTKIFHHYEPTFVKMPIGCVYDMKMWFLDKKNNLHRYHIEIKERYQNMELYDTLPLTEKKYRNVVASCKMGEKPIYLSLLNDKEYYIFDLSKIDMEKTTLKEWWIKDIQYCDNTQKIAIPTYFIPITEAVNNGLM